MTFNTTRRDEPTVRLKLLASAPHVRPISVSVVAGRGRRPGELGWSRLERQPRRVLRRPGGSLRQRLDGWAARYWLTAACVAVALAAVVALVIGVAVEALWLLGALWAGVRGLLAVVGLAALLVGPGRAPTVAACIPGGVPWGGVCPLGTVRTVAARWHSTDARPAVVLVADLVWDHHGGRHDDICLACEATPLGSQWV